MFPLYFLYDVWAVLFLRVILGAILVAHGWPKIKNLKQNAKNFEGMGFKPGKLFGTIAGILEPVGGIALILGLGVTWISALFALEFITIIIWKLAKKMPLVGGYELDLVILAGMVVLFSLGAGAYSLDRLLFGIL